MGSLRTSMATCGYEDIPSFHRAEVMVAPALQTEGKHLQRDQSVGMGATAAAAAAPTTDGVAADNGGGPVGLATDSAARDSARRRVGERSGGQRRAPSRTMARAGRRRRRCWSSTSGASTPS